MSKPHIRTTTSARVTVEVEVVCGSWGEQCKLDLVYSQAADEAVGHLRRALSAAGSKARILCVKRVEAVTTSTSGD